VNIFNDKKSLHSSLIQESLNNISEVQRVVLEKGQALIIPPGYFVYTEARSLSVMLDIISPSKEQMSLYSILSIPIPCLLGRDRILTSPKNSNDSNYLYRNETIICTQVRLSIFHFDSLFHYHV
jgi:hypothetical protein